MLETVLEINYQLHLISYTYCARKNDHTAQFAGRCPDELSRVSGQSNFLKSNQECLHG